MLSLMPVSDVRKVSLKQLGNKIMTYVTLELAKQHLNVEESYKDDDGYISGLIEVAEGKVAKELSVKKEDLATIDGGEDIPAPLVQAILLNIGGYYASREEITVVQTRPLVQGALYLVDLYRDYSK